MPKIPGIPHLRAVRALEKVGFHVARQGKHIVMTDGRRIVTIPRHDPVDALTDGWYCPGCWPHTMAIPRTSLKLPGPPELRYFGWLADFMRRVRKLARRREVAVNWVPELKEATLHGMLDQLGLTLGELLKGKE